MKKIYLEEILRDYVTPEITEGDYGINILDSCRVDEIINAIKEACKLTLELAAENAEINYSFAPICSCSECGQDGINDKSILDTINQIE